MRGNLRKETDEREEGKPKFCTYTVEYLNSLNYTHVGQMPNSLARLKNSMETSAAAYTVKMDFEC